jgi:hypothetical protein
MASVLSIIIKTTKQGSGDKESAKGLDKLKGAAVAAGAAVATVTAAGVVLKQVYNFAKEGAELEMVSNRFDRLAESVGSTGDAMRDDLTEATEGLYSQSELMASAADLMALGLAKNHDEVLRLADVSAGLNMDMNQLVLTLTNMTTMRFDALGVSVDGFDAKVQALEASGLSAADAFKEAFLVQAEEQLVKVGNAADESIGTFMRLESSVKNLADETKRGLVPAFEELSGSLVDTIDQYLDYKSVLGEASSAQHQHLNALAIARYGSISAANVLKVLREEFVRINYETASYDQVLLNFGSSLEDISGDFRGVGAAISDTTTDYQWLLSSSLDLTASTESYIEKLAALQERLVEARESYGETSDEVKGLEGDIASLEASHQRQTDTFILGLLAQMGMSEEMQLQYALNAGLITESAAREVLAMQAVAEAMKEGRLRTDEQASAISYVIDHINNLDGMTAVAYVDVYIREHGGSSYWDSPQTPSISGNYGSNPGGGGYAQGGSWLVPGSGIIDGTLVQFMATPGERVTVDPPGRSGSGAGGGGNVNNFYINGAQSPSKVADEIVRKIRAQGVRV